MRWRHVITGCIVILACLLADLATKQAFFIDPLPDTPFSFFGGLLSQINHKNEGITFNIPIPQPLIILITSTILVFILVQWWRAQKQSQIAQVIALSFLIGGSLGNLHDRLFLHFVRDWLLAFYRSAFNIADLCIASGFIAWLWLLERDFRHNQKPSTVDVKE